MLYLIYSREHSAWWNANSRGYTTDPRKAGRYSLTDAARIVKDANEYADPENGPQEFCYPVPPDHQMGWTHFGTA